MPSTQLLIIPRRAGRRSLEPVLSRWTRKFHALVWFPVMFRSSIDRIPFMVTSILLLFYAIAPGNHDNGLYGADLQLLKYGSALFFLSWFMLLMLTRQRINTSPLFPLAALALSIAGVYSFIYSIAIKPGMTTHASALIPLIIIAFPLVIPTQATWADSAAVTQYLLRFTGLAAIFYVLWYAANYASGLQEDDPGSYTDVGFAYAPVCFMILCGLFRRKVLLILAVALVGLSLILRISSTTGFIALFAIIVIAFYRLNYRRLVRVACVLLAGTIIVANLALFMNKDLEDELYSIEPLMKQDVLEATSNNQFRLGIINAARDEMAERSIWTGKFFAGDVDVYPQKYLPWVEGPAPIHSEYVVIIQQGGLMGYGLLTGLFVGVALFWAKAARFAHAAGDAASETLFDSAQAINITYMLCLGGNPAFDDPKTTLHYSVMILLTIFLARAQPGFVGPIRRRRSGTAYPKLLPGAVRATRA